MQNTEEKRSKRKIIYSALLALLLVLTLLISFGEPLGMPTWREVYAFCGIGADLGDELSLSFIDVGSADACYITCNGKNILIDAAYSTDYNKVSSYLRRNGCSYLDAMILSHPDNDHMGGFSQLIEEFGADKFYIHTLSDELMPNGDDYETLLNSIKENNVELIDIQSDTSVSIDEIDLQFIVPKTEYKSRNDNSLLVKIAYGDHTFFFSGDISDKAEVDYVNSDLELKADVLKVPHHGAKKSATEDFIKKVSPDIAVVSTSGEESGNASYETMHRLEEFCGEVYRTDKHNTVVVTSDGDSLKVQTNG